MHPEEGHAGDHAPELSLLLGHDVHVLRPHHHVNGLVLAEALVHALEHMPVEPDLPVGEHQAVDDVGLADKVRDEGVLGLVVDVRGRPDLLDQALRHHDDGVGHAERLLLVMRHEDEGDPGGPLDLVELCLHVLPELRVQGRQRFVKEQHLRFRHQGTGNGHALLLAAGERGDRALLEAGQRHQPEHFGDFPFDLGIGNFLHAQGEGNVLEDIEMGEEGIALEHGVDIAFVRGKPRDVLPEEKDVALVRLLEPGNDTKGRGLAAPARPQ